MIYFTAKRFTKDLYGEGGNVKTLYLQLNGVGHMVKNH